MDSERAYRTTSQKSIFNVVWLWSTVRGRYFNDFNNVVQYQSIVFASEGACLVVLRDMTFPAFNSRLVFLPSCGLLASSGLLAGPQQWRSSLEPKESSARWYIGTGQQINQPMGPAAHRALQLHTQTNQRPSSTTNHGTGHCSLLESDFHRQRGLVQCASKTFLQDPSL